MMNADDAAAIGMMNVYALLVIDVWVDGELGEMGMNDVLPRRVDFGARMAVVCW